MVHAKRCMLRGAWMVYAKMNADILYTPETSNHVYISYVISCLDILSGSIRIRCLHNPFPGQDFWDPYNKVTGAWPSTLQEKPSELPSCLRGN